ncbi:MAG: hypothetical protein AAF355_03390 [Myxococcota bacterium]
MDLWLLPQRSTTANRVAPELLRAAALAHASAKAARSVGDHEATRDHETTWRLLLNAADERARKAEVEATTREHMEQIERHTLQAERDRRAAHAVEQEMKRELAAKLAQEQAKIAFQAAMQEENFRSRNRTEERDRLHREAAEFIVQRTRVTLAVARALGAKPDEVHAIREQIISIERRSNQAAAEALRSAHQILFEAETLLGQARLQDAVDPEPVHSLRAACREASFPCAQQPQGFAIRPASLFSTGTRLQRGALLRLAGIIASHPIGPVLIEVGGRVQGARRRLRRIIHDLSELGIDAARLHGHVEAGPRGVAFIFTRYYALSEQHSSPQGTVQDDAVPQDPDLVQE